MLHHKIVISFFFSLCIEKKILASFLDNNNINNTHYTYTVTLTIFLTHFFAKKYQLFVYSKKNSGQLSYVKTDLISLPYCARMA